MKKLSISVKQIYLLQNLCENIQIFEEEENAKYGLMWFGLDEFNYISFYFDLHPSFDSSISLKSISYQVYLFTKIVDVNFGYKKI